MKTSLILYIIALCIFLPIDLLWIGVVAKDFYREGMGALMSDKPRMDVGLIFYALFSCGCSIKYSFYYLLLVFFKTFY